MIRSPLALKAGAGFAALSFVGITAASGASSPNPPLPTYRKAMTVSGVVGDGHDHAYVPIKPCRVVDTYQSTAGNLKANVARTFKMSGADGFPAQGGSSGGCGIPATASAVTANISGTSTVGKGYLRAWAAGYAEPNATSLLLQTGVEHFAGLTVPVSSSGVTVRPINAKTRFVMDVTGYYRPSVYGVFGTDGTAFVSSQLALSQKGATGYYSLYSPLDLSTCSVQATSWSAYNATAYPTGHYITVTVTAPDGSLVDAFFQITVTC